MSCRVGRICVGIVVDGDDVYLRYMYCCWCLYGCIDCSIVVVVRCRCRYTFGVGVVDGENMSIFERVYLYCKIRRFYRHVGWLGW